MPPPPRCVASARRQCRRHSPTPWSAARNCCAQVLPLLRRLCEADDVRPELRAKFGVQAKLLSKLQAIRSSA